MGFRKIGAVILAGGASERMRTPKPLLDWFGDNFINTIIKKLLTCEIDQVVVVTGAKSEEVNSSIIQEKKVHVVTNVNWAKGQSTSINSGVKFAIENSWDAVIFVTVDQPQISTKLISAIISCYKESNHKIVVTRADGKITPPTLFSKEYFVHLTGLIGDEGARKVVTNNDHFCIDWNAVDEVLDIDTIEDYNKAINNARRHKLN